MLDTLDLESVVKEGKLFRRTIHQIRVRSYLLTGLILMMIAFIWVSGYSPSQPLKSSDWHVRNGLTFSLFFVLIVIWLISYWLPIIRLMTHHIKTTREVLPNIVEGFEVYILSKEGTTVSGSRRTILSFAFLFFILVFTESIGLPPVIRIALFLTVGAVIAWGPSVRRVFDPSIDSETRRYRRQILRQTIILSIFVMVFILAVEVLVIILLPELIMSPVIGIVIAGLIPFILLQFFWRNVYARGADWILTPAIQGQYDLALARIERHQVLLKAILYDVNTFRAVVLLMQGDSQKAKPLLTAYLIKFQASTAYRVAGGLLELGECLELEERYDEALPILEYALKIAPDHPLAYSALANYYLSIQNHAERALAITDAMMLFLNQFRGSLSRRNQTILRATNLGVRAFALANVGRFEEADRVMSEAKRQCPKYHVPLISFLLNTQAHMLLAQDKHPEALMTFQKAIDTDPNGAEGKRAQRELEKWQAANAS